MSGEKFFGLEGYEQITSLIENLPGAVFCNNYKKWSNNRPPAAKLPPPTFSMRICRAIAVSPMAECKALLKVWERLEMKGMGHELVSQDITGHVCAWPFLEPIAAATSELENYSQKVKRPMDLGTIQQKLNDGKYMNPHQVRFDVIQVCVLILKHHQHPPCRYGETACIIVGNRMTLPSWPEKFQTHLKSCSQIAYMIRL